jgi:hypothetical protein
MTGRVHNSALDAVLHIRVAPPAAGPNSVGPWSRRGRTSATAGASGREGDGMRLLGWRRRRGDHGMTTAEYAVGTVAACGFGGVLYKIVTSEPIMHLVENLISRALNFLG